MTYLPIIPTSTLTTKCPAVNVSPGDLFPPRCGLIAGHDGAHTAYNSWPTTGVFRPATWP